MLSEGFDELKRKLLKLGYYSPIAVLPSLPLLIDVSFFDISWDESPAVDLPARIKTVKDYLELKGRTINTIVVDNSQRK